MKALYATTLAPLFGAAMASTALVGCGGSSGGGGASPSATVNINGGITTGIVTSNQAIDPTAGPVPVTLADGTKLTVFGDPVAVGDKLITIPAGSTILRNLFLDDGRTQGDLSYSLGSPNTFLTRYFLGTLANTNGATGAQTIQTFGFKAAGSSFTLYFTGPFVITSGQAKLHVGSIVVYFTTASQGLTSLPTSLTGQLPADNQSLNGAGISLTQQVNPLFARKQFKLVIGINNSVKKSQVQVTDASGAATFVDLTPDANDVLNGNNGTGGVNSIELDYNDYQLGA